MSGLLVRRDERGSDLEPDAAAVVGLPSQTALRFVILVVAVLVSSVYVYNALYYTLHLNQERDLLVRCTQAGRDAVDAVAAQAAQTVCRAPAQRARVLWTVLFAPVTVIVALVLVALAPWARSRRFGLTEVPVAARTAHLRATAVAALLGLSATPRLTWQRRRVTGAATAYGLPWQPSVELAPGTVALAASDPERFDSLLRHEFAHVRNRDVVLGSAAAGSFLAFVVVAILPFAVSLVPSEVGWRTGTSAVLQLALIAALVLLVQRDLLRVREHEADLRALSVGPAPARDLLTAQRPGGLRRLMGTHPSAEARLEVLRSPGTLLRVPALQAAAAGFFAFLPVPVAGSLAAGWATGTDAGPTGVFLVACALAMPFGAWAGAVALRLASDTRRVHTGAAVGLFAGVGATVALVAFDDGLYQPVRLLSGRGTDGLALLVLLLVFAGLFAWLTDAARRSLAHGWSLRRTALTVCALGAVSASLVLGALVRIWNLASVTDAGQTFGKDPGLALAEVVVGTSSAALGTGLGVVLLVPLALSLPPLRARHAPTRSGLAVALAVLVGSAGGWTAVRLSDARLRSTTTEEVRDQVLVLSRHVLVNEILGLGMAGVITAVLVAAAGKRLMVLAAAAATASGGTGLVQVLKADRLDAGDRVDAFLSFGLLSALVALVAVAVAASARRAGCTPRRRTRVALVIAALALPFAAAFPAAAYVAAPQGALREIPAFVAWSQSAGADVFSALDECASLALSPAPSQTAFAHLSGGLSAAHTQEWRSDAVREVQRRLVAALEQCRIGMHEVLHGQRATSSFRRSFCGYWGALLYLQGASGSSSGPDLGVLRLCGGRPSAASG